MASIGSADLLIVPTFKGLSGKVNAALAGVDASAGGESVGKSFFGGMASGAALGLWSTVTEKAIGVVTGHMGAAVSRLDTLKNYPLVMQSLGVEAAEAQTSIETMSERLQGLPTRLDDMAQTVQGMYAAAKQYGVSLTDATDAGLALNSMLLAGGGSAQVVNSAMEQFRQMLSKGKPDMQDWRSLLSAAPGQMDQLAKSMLGAEAQARDLYYALGGGNEADAHLEGVGYASVTMDQLLQAIVDMGPQFESAAEDAQGGISTAFANMSNAVNIGLANVLDAFGRENIVGAVADVKEAIRTVFSDVADFAEVAAPHVIALWDSVVTVAEAVWPSVERIAGSLGNVLLPVIDLGTGALETFGGAFMTLRDLTERGGTGTKLFGDSVHALLGPAQAVREGFTVTGDAVESALDRARDASSRAREAHEEYLDVVASGARDVAKANDAYQAQAAELEHAGNVIEAYAGRTDLTASQQRELAEAIEVVNAACGTQYEVAEGGAGVYDPETESILNNTEAIWDNVRARQAAAQAEGLGVARQAAEEAAAAAVNEMQAQRAASEEAYAAIDMLAERYGSLADVRRKAMEVGPTGTPTSEALEAQKAWGAWVSAAAAMREADEAQRAAAQSAAELAAEEDALMAKASGAELTAGQMALTSSVAMQAFGELGYKSELSIVSFADAIEACQGNAEALQRAMSDPTAAAQIVAAYDGTAASLQGVFDELGIGWDSAKAAALDAQGTISQMGDWLMDLSNAAYAEITSMGESADGMAARLAAAGVSMQDLNEVGGEAFEGMLERCGGSIDTLMSMVENYNNVPVVTKEGDVIINDEPLYDAQGRIVEWNGTTLVDRKTGVEVDAQQLTDAQGKVYTWNGTELKSMSATVSVSTSGIWSTQADLNELARQYDGRTIATSYVRVASAPTSVSKELFATGGHVVPRHAAGYYATGPTLTNFGLVGEDGIEYVRNNDDGSSDVYPISNRRYSDPLADSIAARMAELGAGRASVVVNLNYDAGADANRMARDIARSLRRYDLARG